MKSDDGRRSVLMRGLRIVMSYIATHPLPFVVSVTGGAIYAVATVASSYVLGRVTDEIVYPGLRESVSSGTLWAGAGALIGVMVLRALSIVLRRYFAGMTTYRMQA